MIQFGSKAASMGTPLFMTWSDVVCVGAVWYPPVGNLVSRQDFQQLVTQVHRTARIINMRSLDTGVFGPLDREIGPQAA